MDAKYLIEHFSNHFPSITFRIERLTQYCRDEGFNDAEIGQLLDALVAAPTISLKGMKVSCGDDVKAERFWRALERLLAEERN